MAKKLISILVFILVCIVAVKIFSRFVPYSMDEFSLYHTLSCFEYPNNSVNTFRTGCGEFDLKLPFTSFYLPLREYTYMGNLTSFYYWPVFKLWKDPESARLMGMLFLGLEALTLSWIFKVKIWKIFLFLLLFFPFFFQHVVDTGVVGFQIFTTFLIYFLIQKWLRTKELQNILLIFALIFIGLATKLTYIWLLPAYFLIGITEWFLERRKNVLKQLGISVVIFVLCLGYLFLAKDRNNKYFFEEFFVGRPSTANSLKDELFLFSPYMISQSLIYKSLINPLEATQRIYEVKPVGVPGILYTIFILLPVPLLLIFIYLKKKNIIEIFRSAILYFAFWLTTIIIYRTSRAWATHHLILAYPFLILSLFAAVKIVAGINKKILYLFTVVFVLFNSYFFSIFRHQEVKASDDPSKIIVNTLLGNKYLASNYYYVVVDWGMSYFQSLYGDANQGVIYMEPFNNFSQVVALNKIKSQYERKLLFIYNIREMASNLDMIKTNFEVVRCRAISPSAVWQIIIEKDYDQNNVCQ